MSKVYILNEGGGAVAMKRVSCRDEARELQELLFRNHDLLPGDQIRPEDPRRWLLIRREMPVEDPGTGYSRWSIDFFFVDQDGIPTFVECKRFSDTRSRREIVGQMLEYAANGHFYWSKETLRSHVDTRGLDLEEAIRSLRPEDPVSADEFLELVELNLREGQVRLIFFLEEAPWELRSIADFLNRQMERTEVLIVEAKQYEKNGMRVILPSLFGYTEQARRVKRIVTGIPVGRRKWDETSFFADAASRLDPPDVQAMQHFHALIRKENFEIRWGRGEKIGSLNVVLPGVSTRSVITVYSDGRLYLNVGWFEGTEGAEALKADLIRCGEDIFTATISQDTKWPVFEFKRWGSLIEPLVVMLKELHSRHADGVDGTPEAPRELPEIG